MTNTIPPADAIKAVSDLATRAAEGEELELGSYYVFNNPVDGIVEVDLTGEQWLNRPARRRGQITVTDTASLLAYWDKHQQPEVSEVYADRQARTVTAVIDAHGPDDNTAGWGQHRATLALRYTPAFQAWHGINKKLLTQVDFAEFVEENRPDIRTPPAADLMEMVQTFHATTSVRFRSGTILKSGERQLSYVETIDATSGREGKLTIPDHLTVALLIFDGQTTADQFTARFRYRIDGGNLKLGIVLDELTSRIDAAFEAVVAQVGEKTGATVLRGTPAAPHGERGR